MKSALLGFIAFILGNMFELLEETDNQHFMFELLMGMVVIVYGRQKGLLVSRQIRGVHRERK